LWRRGCWARRRSAPSRSRTHAARRWPPALSDIVERALQTDREARFPTALALRQALEGRRERHGIEHGHERIATCLAARLGPFIAARNERIRIALERHIGDGNAGREMVPGSAGSGA
jgi:hypothetical protein